MKTKLFALLFFAVMAKPSTVFCQHIDKSFLLGVWIDSASKAPMIFNADDSVTMRYENGNIVSIYSIETSGKHDILVLQGPGENRIQRMFFNIKKINSAKVRLLFFKLQIMDPASKKWIEPDVSDVAKVPHTIERDLNTR
jgi:hypothetical protein